MTDGPDIRARDLRADLGPDPEPLGVRAGLLLERVAREYNERRAAGAPAVCPLGVPIGKSGPCSEARCPWFRVPGTVRVCAVEQWSPRARRDARIARWFATRADEIRAARGQRDANS
jgi:hypothetical protein